MAFDLAVLRDYLYWTDRDSSNDHGIARVAKTGGDSVQLIDKLSGSHGLVAINNTRAATSCKGKKTNNKVKDIQEGGVYMQLPMATCKHSTPQL